MERIYHHWQRWECFPAGFYETSPPDGMTQDEARQTYAEFLRDTPRFEAALDRVLSEWPVSCEQFLSNDNINRIAWLGQSSMCIATGIPSVFRGGFFLLTDDEQRIANDTAQKWLTKWINENEKKDRGIHYAVGSAGLPEWNPEPSPRPIDEPAISAVVQGDLFRHPEKRCDA